MEIKVGTRQLGDDLVVMLLGGKEHIGCVVAAEPGKKAKVIKFGAHKEHIVAKPFAEKLAKRKKQRVVCISGIHFDKATKKQIEEIKQTCEELERCI